MNKVSFKLASGCLKDIFDLISWVVNRHKTISIATASAVLYGVYFFKRPWNCPPGPWGWPYIGSVHELNRNTSGSISEDCDRLAQKYGDIVCLWMGAERYVVILNSYDVIKEAYIKSGSDFAHRIPAYSLGDFNVVEPLFNADYDENHKLARRIVLTVFKKFVREQLDTVLEVEMCKLHDELVQNGNTAHPVRKHLENVLSNMFCAIHFNKTYTHNDKELETVREGVNIWFDAFYDAFKDALTGHTLFRPKPMNAQEAVSKLDTFVRHKIWEHVETFDPNNPRDTIDVFLQNNALDVIGESHLSNLIMELMPNGVITASDALIWMLIFLHKYPEYQEKLYQEITNLKADTPVLAVDRGRLPLVESFIMETYRLKPPVQISMINTPSHNARLLRGYRIPQNSSILCNYASVNRDPKLFPQPKKFWPERFMKDGHIVPCEGFLTFGIGRRNCVGEHLIRASLFYILANLVQRYDIELVEQEYSDEGSVLSDLFQEIPDIKVKLTERSRSNRR